MGSCCAAQSKSEAVDNKEERLDIEKPQVEEVIEERSKKPDSVGKVDRELEFFENASNFISHNDDVNVNFI